MPSPQVATYDLQPEMSAPEVTEKVTAAIRSRKYGLIVLNFANCDMVGAYRQHSRSRTGGGNSGPVPG